MHFAAFNGAKKCLKRLLFLLQCKQQINTPELFNKYTPLMVATMRKHLSCVQLLTHAEATIDAEDGWGQTALHFAAAKGFDEAIPLLVNHGANVNYVSNAGYIYNTHDGHYTPIHFAAQHGHNNAIKLLIQHGADTNLKTQLGKTALDLARENNHPETAKLLLLPQ